MARNGCGLLEVSITAFPAYPQTNAARRKDVEAMKKQKLEQRKKALKERMSMSNPVLIGAKLNLKRSTLATVEEHR